MEGMIGALMQLARAGRGPLEKTQVDMRALVDSVLREQGNVGSASIWLMLDGLMQSGRVSTGHKILCVVPESGRALVGFMLLEAV